MKIVSKTDRVARKVSLLAISRTYKNLAKLPPEIKLIWFVTDEKGKLIDTGNSSMKSIRHTQCGFRKYHRKGLAGYFVNALDIHSGLKFTIKLSEALNYSNKRLRDMAVYDIISLHNV